MSIRFGAGSRYTPSAGDRDEGRRTDVPFSPLGWDQPADPPWRRRDPDSYAQRQRHLDRPGADRQRPTDARTRCTPRGARCPRNLGVLCGNRPSWKGARPRVHRSLPAPAPRADLRIIFQGFCSLFSSLFPQRCGVALAPGTRQAEKLRPLLPRAARLPPAPSAPASALCPRAAGEEAGGAAGGAGRGETTTSHWSGLVWAEPRAELGGAGAVAGAAHWPRRGRVAAGGAGPVIGRSRAGRD